MMIYTKLTFAFLITLFISFFSGWNDPEGWSALKEAIEKTKLSEVSKLQGRTFDLVIPGGTIEYVFSVAPENAFKLERLGPDKFRLTITNPQALIKTGGFVNYHPIEWSLKNKNTFSPEIEGKATCLYEVIFSQVGVGELDLSKYEANYDITYEISNQTAISEIKRQGKGYSIMRVPNATGETKMRLRIKAKSGDENLQTGWINIPNCITDTPTPNPPTITQPLPPQVINPPEIYAAADALVLKTEGISFCEESTGIYCATLTVKATNTSNRTARCNNIAFHMYDGNRSIASTIKWVELNPGQNTIFEVVLKSTYRPQTFTFRTFKTECIYR
ncbi:hypothetical protein [Pedobacter sp. MC2016-24]|uniref:hypothetical protein n=1 Tax=Pedobacter sp. MC2016-24 TaxID=2780090 RepID=UPI00187E8C01|nr:hypothetical protein [Pedobacter sp. MC2016-24]MBE9603146.1 hypothetical protein [Pedobacter sp. MC2016-24]